MKRCITQWTIDAGLFLKCLCTDFDDPKVLYGPTELFLHENNVILRAAPTGRQNQNGLVERAWPTPTGHLAAVKHVRKYILSTMDLGLQFTSKPNSSLESYIHFPLSDDDPTLPSSTPTLNSFCNANWGPQDASSPSHTNLQNVSIE
jgi:hypothetical protein